MTTTSTNSPQQTQLDRIEGQLQHVDSQVGQVLQRVARMEERQDSQAASVDSHRLKLDQHDQRIGSLEVAQAVQSQTQTEASKRSDGRWSNAGAIGMVVLGAAMTTAGYFVLAYSGVTP